MPIFEYAGFDGNGGGAKGIIQAPSMDEALERLSGSGVFVSTVKPASFGKSGNLPDREIAAFSREMASYVRAGAPVTEALASVAQGRGTSRLAMAAAVMVDLVESGLDLSAAMERAGCFPGLAREMVASGEGRGSLGQTLHECSDLYARKSRLSGRLAASMAYPAFLGLACLGTAFFMLNRVIPVMAKVYADMKVPLPLPTRIVVEAANLAGSAPVLAVLGLLTILTWLLAAKGFKSGISGSEFAESIPLAGRIVVLDRTARAMRALGGLLRGGVKLDSALVASARVAGNGMVAAALMAASGALARGSEISTALSAFKGLPREAVHLLRAGERNGDLVLAAEGAAELFESEAAAATEALAALAEPVMVALVGGMAGFLVIASLLPMFRMNMMGL